MSDTSPAPRPPRKPRRRWRWHVPPALMHGAEQLEGGEILDEMKGEQALVMWQSVRDVSLWGSVPPEERGSLFTADAHARRLRQVEEAGIEPSILQPIHAIAELLRTPEGVVEADVTAACRAVSKWADDAGMLGTALAFAQAGAVASPTDAATGYKVGQLARRRAEYARAESWFRRVIGLGRQAKDWESYSLAFLGLANLYIQRGNYPVARRFLIRCLRAARRHGLREVQGKAYHDLFVVGYQTERTEEAYEAARAAFRAYGPRHPRLPSLANDLGVYWLLQGRFALALEVFKAALPVIEHPCERLLTWGSLARAAGGVGEREEFDRAWDEIWSYAGDWQKRENAPWALLDAARGATTLRDWARAERAAVTARDLAQSRGEGHVVAEAETVLDSVARKRRIDEVAAAAPPADLSAETLAGDVKRYLGVRAPVG